MIDQLDYQQLQHLWWLLCSVVGALFLFLTFVQGGQSLLWQIAKTETERDLAINGLGRKWELTFTTLVLFGGALFASFPKFYSTSFGGAYWVWILILFTFIVQAVSYEYRKKPANLLGARLYESFLLLNGTVGILLIGAAVGTFFTGANFQLSQYNLVTWTHPLRGLEAAFSLFNLSLGLFLVFNARTLGALYLLNAIDMAAAPAMEERLRKASMSNLLLSLPFLVYVLVSLLLMKGYGIVDAQGTVALVPRKYLANLLANPWLIALLGIGLLLVVAGVLSAARTRSLKGIWLAGPGTVLTGLAVLLLPAYNHTAFYPSRVDLQSSLTIANASSSPYTLMVMTWVALAIPFVLAYVAYVWWAMDRRKLTLEDTAY